MLKQFILSIISLTLSYCTYIEHVHLIQPIDAFAWDFTKWSSSVALPIGSLVNVCDGNPILGGFPLNGLDFLTLNIADIPVPHVALKIEFTLFLIDSITPTESIDVIVDSQTIGSITLDDINDGVPLDCGGAPTDYKKEFGFIIEDHTSASVQLDLLSTTLGLFVYWGVNNVKISYLEGCPNDLIPFNDDCWTQEGVQNCYNFLENLDPSGTNNQSVDNTCDAFNVSGEYVYEFAIKFQSPYVHNTTCITQEVEFQDELLDEGLAWPNFDEWQYYPNNQTIHLRIKHKDLVSKYSCDYDSNHQDYFQWKCRMNIYLYLNGFKQFTYWYEVKSRLNKVVSDEVVVDITQNEVIGDCCDNVLQVDSVLKICLDSDCNTYHDDNSPIPYTVTRLTPITVEHQITTPEFAGDYYVNVLNFYLGFYEYDPLDVVYVSLLGKTRITFIPNLATDGMQIRSVAELKLTQSTGLGPNRRRVLSSSEAEYFDAEIQISLKDEQDTIEYKEQKFVNTEDQLQKAQEETEESFIGLVFVAGIVGTFSICMIIGGTIYCKMVLGQIKQLDLKNVNNDQIEKASEMFSSRTSNSARSIIVQQQSQQQQQQQ